MVATPTTKVVAELCKPDQVCPAHPLPLLQAAVDFRSDPVLYEACKEDSESLCLGVDHGGGRIQACLVRAGGQDPGQLDDTGLADRIQATFARQEGQQVLVPNCGFV